MHWLAARFVPQRRR